MTSIHVHLHDSANLQPPFMRKACGCTTHDSDDGEGKWVTIGGAHVHIGKGGKIDKGPKELMEKTENGAHAHTHASEAAAHNDAANAKGPDHPDTFLHKNAVKAHETAAHHFQQADAHATAGNINQARSSRHAAERAVGIAQGQKEELDRRNVKQSDAVAKPAVHAGLHSDAEDDVKGSEKHEAEHKRLMKEYDKSKAGWERNAINNHVANNASAAMKAKAQMAHGKALQASEHAKTTGAIEHHQEALKAIDAAHELHDRAGGEGSTTKRKELEAMRKPHAKEVAKHEKENPSTSLAYVSRHSKLEDAQKMQMQQDKPAKVFHHPEGGYFVPQHAKASGAYEKAGHKVALDYNGKPPAGSREEPQYPGRDEIAPGHHDRLSEVHRAMGGPNQSSVIHNALFHSKQHAGDAKVDRYRKYLFDLAEHKGVKLNETVGPRPGTSHQEKLSPRQAALRERGSSRYAGRTNSNPSALDKIAKRVAKKVAEDAADQDPKHKK